MSLVLKVDGLAPRLIDGSNLSCAWGRAILHILDNAGTEIAPLVLSISGFRANGEIPEDPRIRHAIDELLRNLGRVDVDTVAFTIFPERYSRLVGGDRAKLFELYRDTFPRLREMNLKSNRRGLYFERLIMFGSGPMRGNQLEWILSQWERTGVRRSMLQASIFDPARDHVPNAQLGFPCLQQISFVPTGPGLVMNAFYATQQLLDKAYGNYLGLAQLGSFMANEMGLKLVQLNVFVGVAKLERIGKQDPRLRALESVLRESLA